MVGRPRLCSAPRESIGPRSGYERNRVRVVPVRPDRHRRGERRLAEYAYDRLTGYDDIRVLGPPGDERVGLVSFVHDDIHAHDLSSILDDYGVAIRASDHCTQPLHDDLGVTASARASFYLYNTREEVDQLIEAVDGARELFSG